MTCGPVVGGEGGVYEWLNEQVWFGLVLVRFIIMVTCTVIQLNTFWAAIQANYTILEKNQTRNKCDR